MTKQPAITEITELAARVIAGDRRALARASHANATLADLYDPDLMPANLRKAHANLDRAVDRLWQPNHA